MILWNEQNDHVVYNLYKSQIIENVETQIGHFPAYPMP